MQIKEKDLEINNKAIVTTILHLYDIYIKYIDILL